MKFGPPHFQEEGWVSLWVGTRPAADLPKDYFEEQYEDDDQPISKFAGDFGFGFYDHDFIELHVSDSGPRPTKDILSGHSYATTFLDPATAAAAQGGLGHCEYLFLMYDFSYLPSTTGIHSSPWFRFVGRFRYQKDGT